MSHGSNGLLKRRKNKEIKTDNNINGTQHYLYNGNESSPTTAEFAITNLTEKPEEITGFRGVLARELVREIPILQKIQSYRNRVFDFYFLFASTMGEEVFYIIFLPLSCWVMSPQLSVYAIWNLGLGIGLGNCIKNHFCIPRPPHPPIWSPTQLEKDHGFLSTHTVSSITLPICTIMYYYYDNGGLPMSLPVAILLFFIWSISISFSRIYNGYHSIQDVLAGTLFGYIIAILWILVGRTTVDCWIDSNNSILYKLLGIFLSGLFVLMVHPKPNKPYPINTSAREESALVFGTLIGGTSGFILNRYFNLPASIISPLDLQDTPFQILAQQPYLNILRISCGLIVIITVRQLSKKLYNSILEGNYSSRFMGLEKQVMVKYLTYITIGASVFIVMPPIYWSLGLQHRPDFITLERTLCV